MKKMIEKIAESAKQITLNEHEKSVMFQNLKMFIEEDQLNFVDFESKSRYSIFSDFSKMRVLSITGNPKFALSILFVLFVLFVFGVGSTFAAQDSLPDSLLYPIKIGIDEKITSAFSIGPVSDAGTQFTQANNRLMEKDRLSQNGSLTNNEITELSNNFSYHVDQIKNDIALLKRRGDVVGAGFIEGELNNLLSSNSLLIKILNSN